MKRSDFERIKDYMALKEFKDGEIENGQEADGVILVIQRSLHDSGFPFLHAYGYDKRTKTLFNLGWHDHFLINKSPVNMDSFGSNIIHIYPWKQGERWTCSAYYVSSFELTEGGVLR